MHPHTPKILSVADNDEILAVALPEKFGMKQCQESEKGIKARKTPLIIHKFRREKSFLDREIYVSDQIKKATIPAEISQL